MYIKILNNLFLPKHTHSNGYSKIKTSFSYSLKKYKNAYLNAENFPILLKFPALNTHLLSFSSSPSNHNSYLKKKFHSDLN